MIMNDKVKNIISNILGLLMTGSAVVGYFLSKIELTQFGIILAIGLALFLFKSTRVKDLLAKFLDKKLK
jgi:uncharacterized membrane protein YbaN (DUF454 family)